MTGCYGYANGKDTKRIDALERFAERKGVFIEKVFTDRDGECAELRKLMNLTKLGACRAVIIPSEYSLGRDRYLRMDVERFFVRHGVKIVSVDTKRPDRRHELAESIAGYNTADPDWSLRRGMLIPTRPDSPDRRTEPPYGYRTDEYGSVKPEYEEASIVRSVFEMYAAGERPALICDAINERIKDSDVRFGSVTVKVMLNNDVYIGKRLSNGVFVPPILPLKVWFLAKERQLNEQGAVKNLMPFFGRIRSDKPVSYVDKENYKAAFVRTGDNNVDTPSLDREICAAVRELASEDNARRFFEEFVLKEKAEAENAFPDAARELNTKVAEFKILVSRASLGCSTSQMQRRLELFSDEKTLAAWRLRRIRSEKELFSMSLEDIESFFKRASELEMLSAPEKKYFSEAFVSSIRIENGTVRAFMIDPTDGEIKKRDLMEVLVDDSELNS